MANKAVPGEVTATTAANVVWLPDGDDLRLGWSVTMATAGSAYTVWVDAVTGEVADARETAMDTRHARHARHARAAQAGGGCDPGDVDGVAACLFLPDPVATAGDAVAPDEADDLRVPVELRGLDDPESGALVGEFVDLESPHDSNPPVREPDGVWDQGRDEAGFEAAMAYFWIDLAQRRIQDLGFDDVRNESFPVVAVEASEVDNAFYTNALDTVFLGVGSSGIDAGEDAQVILHEYGHAVLHQQVPNLLFNDAGGAYHEGFGDVLAGLLTLERNRDPGCLFAWFLGAFGPDGCGRRLDTDKVFPDDLENAVHADGQIWSGAVFDILEGLLAQEDLDPEDCSQGEDCSAAVDRVLTTVIAANEFLTGAEDLPEIAQAYVLANETAFGGADADLVEGAFADHGLVPGGDGIVGPDGTPTGEVAAVELAVDITHSYRGDLELVVHVVDADFEDLCDPIVLLRPDGGDGADNVTGRVDVSDSDCADLAPPSPDRQWVLVAVDSLPRDTGQVNGFAVVVEGRPFLATGVPAPIADADPTGTAVIVNGTGRRVPQQGEQAPGEAGDGVPFVSLAISHTYIGDLQVRAGAADAATGRVLCSVPVLEPDPQASGDDAEGEVDMSACAEHFPPSAEVVWFLEAVDTAALDTGAIERFEVFAPDGTLVAAADTPVPIPDDDPEGAVALAP